MTQLDRILELLQALEGGMEGQQDEASLVIPSLAERRDSFISSILSTVRESFANSYEASQYYDIVTNLVNVLELKLRYNDRNFLLISGIRVNKSGTKLRVVTPDLSSLGSHSDWLAMQESGHNLFRTTRVSDPVRGWQSYYLSYLSGSGPRSDVYPAIMRARLSWGEGHELAPYWYWYDKSVSTANAYPRQDVLNFSSDINQLAQDLVNEINQETYTLESLAIIEELTLSLVIEDELTEIFDGIKAPERKVVVGSYKRAPITQEGILQMLRGQNVAAGRSFQRGTKRVVQLYDTKTGRFTGLRKEIEKL